MRMADYLQTNMALLYPDGTSKLFTCGTPNYKSSMNSIIRNHVESVKKQKTILTCEICDFTCRYKNSMKKHVASAHRGKYFYKKNENYSRKILQQCKTLPWTKRAKNDKVENLPAETI